MTPHEHTLPMKAQADTDTLSGVRSESRARARDFWELTKPRLSLLSVITTMVGYLSANPPQNGAVFFACLLVGTSLAAGGAAALNMWMESEADARMVRTRGRPIPSGLMTREAALSFGLALCVAGDVLLWLKVHPLSGLLALLTQLSYVLVYTPLKRVTVWNTTIGAVPGALPPLIGWAAAEPASWTLGWILFAILFAWQIPHFMAIAWMHRKDYGDGGFKMVTVVEPTGRRAALEALVYTVVLVVTTVLPPVLGLTTWWLYGLVAALSGVWFLLGAWSFWKAPSDQRDRPARRLFLISIAHLPLILFALVVDRWFAM